MGVENSVPGFRVETDGRMSPQPQLWACFLHFLSASHPAGSAVRQLGRGQWVERAGSSQKRSIPSPSTSTTAMGREVW